MFRFYYFLQRLHAFRQPFVPRSIFASSREDARVRLRHDVLFQSLPRRVQFRYRRPSPRRVSLERRLRVAQERLHAPRHAQDRVVVAIIVVFAINRRRRRRGVVVEARDERLDVAHERAGARLTHFFQKRLERQHGRRGRGRHREWTPDRTARRGMRQSGATDECSIDE